MAKHIHKHPFPKGWEPNRLDMGYDGTFTEEIVAPFPGLVIFAGVFNGWRGSHGVILKADEQVPNIESWLPTRCIFFVEGLEPTVHSGQHLEGGHQIAKAASNPYNGIVGNIEFGVAQDGPVGSQTDAYAMALGTGSSQARDMVLAFARGCEKYLGVHAPSETGNAGAP